MPFGLLHVASESRPLSSAVPGVPFVGPIRLLQSQCINDTMERGSSLVGDVQQGLGFNHWHCPQVALGKRHARKCLQLLPASTGNTDLDEPKEPIQHLKGT